jgi:hypothetical protein
MFVMPKIDRKKKASIKVDDEGTYTLTFITPLRSEAHFNRIINEDLLVCLKDAGGSLVDSSWENKSIRFNIKNFGSFQVCLMRRYYFLQREF